MSRQGMVRRTRRESPLLLRRAAGWQWDQLCQFSEVLGGGSQEELVSSAKWTSQPEPIEAQDALEMCEQHLDLLPSRREVT